MTSSPSQGDEAADLVRQRTTNIRTQITTPPLKYQQDHSIDSTGKSSPPTLFNLFSSSSLTPLSTMHNDDIFDDEDLYPAPTTAVAIDKDKNSQQAVKWAMENLVVDSTTIALVHVKQMCMDGHHHQPSLGGGGGGSGRHQGVVMGEEMTALFRPYRLFCARKGVKVVDVVLEKKDVSKALIEYINSNNITNIVVGAAKGNALTRKFRHPDVPTTLMKLAPTFCSVYVIWKEKALSVRSAKTPMTIAGIPATPSLTQSISPHRHILGGVPHHHDSLRSPAMTGSRKPTAMTYDRNPDYMGVTASPIRKPQPPRSSLSVSSSLEDMDFHGGHGRNFPSSEYSTGDSSFTSSTTTSSGSFTSSNSSSVILDGSGDLESDLRRLKLELKHTMDMYSTACKEAITARQTAKEINQWKLEESRLLDEVRHAEEAAIAVAEKEKARGKAAMESVIEAQRIAELEVKKRRSAEMESEVKNGAMDSWIYCRKYTIDEIEVATSYFSSSVKIGEGGYGPVYKGCLDHTPVAIKVLRPDAAQGRKQFQQEVEVLSCIRHPNMVLLLGACPEYGCLVYEYMENGSLEDILTHSSLPWQLRFKIAAEITTGLLFLHQTRPVPIVHRDLKPGNILLDRNFTAKISDVGLARLVPQTTGTQYGTTTAVGTFCYIDPEYQHSGILDTKSDVYSLGILLLQILTGRSPMGLTHLVERAIEDGDLEEVLDPRVKDWPSAEAEAFAKLGLKCAEMRKKDRPDLGNVVLPELERLSGLGLGLQPMMP